MFWGLTLTLTEQGPLHVDALMAAVYDALGLIGAVGRERRAEIFAEMAQVKGRGESRARIFG
jgi:hypothetical protein